ncbi:MAG: T9SS type A sorting domain-containing protein [bacterium]|nr:T9SS type A sorting domain-containing protein [bacterium]
MKFCTLFTIILICTNSFASTVTIPDTSTAINSEIRIPLNSSDLTGLGVLSYDVTIEFDSTLVDFVRHENSGTLSNNFTIAANPNTAGQVSVSAAGISSISGNGVLVYLVFQTKGIIGRTDLDITQFTFSDNVEIPSIINGRIIIMSDINNNHPAIESINDTSIVADQSFSITVTADDPDQDALTFSLAAAPGNMIIDQLTGDITWTPAEEDTGIHYVKIEAEDNKGGFDEETFYITVLKEDVTSVNNERIQIPIDFKLNNYPNPFNPSTNIEYTVPVISNVHMEIYNILGQKIRTLVSRDLPAGKYKTQWNGLSDSGINVGSGIYICRLRAGSYTSTKKLMLIR